MNHVMVDLETLGTTPGCPILSIGAVRFDPETNSLGEEFYTNVDLQDCLSSGLKIDGATFYWWLQQSLSARVSLSDKRLSLFDALVTLGDFIDTGQQIWAHGASFDLAVLSSAYATLNISKPWDFRNERDTRTILDLASMRMPQIENAHHALADAKSQAITIMKALRSLKSYAV